MDFAQGFAVMRSPMMYLAVVTLALSAVTIGPPPFAAEARNCAHQAEAAIPLPDQALLRRQPEPDCTFRGQVSTPMTAEETRQKLDFEQQCYAGWERIVRARLHQLQDYVQKMIQRRKAAEDCSKDTPRQIDPKPKRAETATPAVVDCLHVSFPPPQCGQSR
jgi:hypothetical protein